MKKAIFFNLLGLALVSGAFAAGAYTEDFNSYGDNATSGFVNGGQLLLAGTGGLVYNHSSNWKALRLIQDGNQNDTSSFVISGVEKSGQPINVFSATFGLHLKNTDGFAGAGNIADRFSFNFGNIGTLVARSDENGAWSTSQSGNMISIVWDMYDNDTANGTGDSNTNDRIGIEIYKNGSLLANSFRNFAPIVFTSLTTGAFDEVSISWLKDTGLLNMTIGGPSVYNGFDLGGFNPGASDTKFAFAAATGTESMDVFVDNISIITVPEPSSASLLLLGIGGLIALRRSRKS